jgi:prophage regulatory protein
VEILISAATQYRFSIYNASIISSQSQRASLRQWRFFFMNILQERMFLRRPQVEAITGLSRSSIYAKMESGSFPQPVKLSTRSVAWIGAEVLAWMDERILSSRRNA